MIPLKYHCKYRSLARHMVITSLQLLLQTAKQQANPASFMGPRNRQAPFHATRRPSRSPPSRADAPSSSISNPPPSRLANPSPSSLIRLHHLQFQSSIYASGRIPDRNLYSGSPEESTQKGQEEPHGIQEYVACRARGAARAREMGEGAGGERAGAGRLGGTYSG